MNQNSFRQLIAKPHFPHWAIVINTVFFIFLILLNWHSVTVGRITPLYVIWFSLFMIANINAFLSLYFNKWKTYLYTTLGFLLLLVFMTYAVQNYTYGQVAGTTLRTMLFIFTCLGVQYIYFSKYRNNPR